LKLHVGGLILSSALEMPPLLELPRRIFGDGLPFGHRARRLGPIDLRQGVIDPVADLDVNGDPVRPVDIDAVAVEAVCIGVIDGVTLGAANCQLCRWSG
jgi:hypothetical protein